MPVKPSRTTPDKTRTYKEHLFGDSKIIWAIVFIAGTLTSNVDRLITMVVPNLSEHFVPRTEFLQEQTARSHHSALVTKRIDKIEQEIEEMKDGK